MSDPIVVPRFSHQVLAGVSPDGQPLVNELSRLKLNPAEQIRL